MKFIKLLFVLFAVSLGMTATADFKTIDRAHEVPYQSLRLPGGPNGFVLYRKCSDCDVQRSRATVNTRYVFNGETLELRDFRRLVARARQKAINERNYVTVLQNLETDTIVSVTVTL